MQRRGAGLAYNWEQRVITKEKKERIKTITEKNRSKKAVREPILFSARSTFLKGGHYCC